MIRIVGKLFFLLLNVVTLLMLSCSNEKTVPSSTNEIFTCFTDFEYESADSIWKNVKRLEDESAFSGSFVCECPADMMYAFGLAQTIHDSIGKKNALFSFDMKVKAEDKPDAVFVFTIQREDKTVVWKSFPMSDGFGSTNEWYDNSFKIFIPNDMLEDAELNCYVLNKNQNRFFIDDFRFSVKYNSVPTYIDEVETYAIPKDLYEISKSNSLNIVYSEKKNRFMLADDDYNLITRPLSMYYSLVADGDTVDMQLDEWNLTEVDGGYLLKNVNDNVTTELLVSYKNDDVNVNLTLNSIYHKDVNVIRSSLLMPFLYDDFKVYRRTAYVDSVDYHDVYYLDNEGFSLVIDDKQFNMYHLDDISSIQLDVKNTTAYLNTDYYMDHLLIRFPLSDTSDYYVDNSSVAMRDGSVVKSFFTISLTDKKELPRIMPIMNGYESAFIWTEHADWSDIKTHRATYFGSEEINDIDESIGGFAYYGIPVTKSVFYHNPDSVVNYEKNNDYPGLHSSIMTDDAFFDFLKQLSANGFDICLHTPEQYTSNRESLSEALSFMKDNFSSPSWIDHGYNNGIIRNRENMVCDGLDSTSPYYLYDLWKENGVKYPWNASLEDMRPFEEYLYDNNLLRPYPGFGESFPLPKVGRHPSYPEIRMWYTTCTVEPGENWAWAYYFSQDRLDKIVDNRYVYITHIYAPWVTVERGFWEIRDGKVMAKNGFNKALERISDMKRKHLLLPTTISDYMKYQQQLENLVYRLDDDGNVILTNHNAEKIKGLSLICTRKMTLENSKSHNERKTKSGNENIIWFDIEAGETVKVISQ